MPVFERIDNDNTCWIDLDTPDATSAIRFYGGLFGWQADEVRDEDLDGYTTMSSDGKSVAGISSSSDRARWNTYVAVADADATEKAVRDAGGQVVIEPTPIGIHGRFAVFADSTGEQFSVWESPTSKGEVLANEPNTWGYSEVSSNDPEKAMSFYADVFGWTATSNEPMGIPGWSWFLNDKHLGGLIDAAASEDGTTGWINYFGVADLDSALDTATKLGASIIRPKLETPIGWWTIAKDTQGALFGLAQMKI